MKTNEQVAEAIEKIKENKNSVTQYTGFGDDKHAALDAMLDILERRVEDDEIDDVFDDEYVNSAAYSIVDWMNGDEDLDDLLYTK